MFLTTTAALPPGTDHARSGMVMPVAVSLTASSGRALALAMEETGRSAADVVDRALRVYQLVEAHLHDNGGQLRLWRRDGHVETICV